MGLTRFVSTVRWYDLVVLVENRMKMPLWMDENENIFFSPDALPTEDGDPYEGFMICIENQDGTFSSAFSYDYEKNCFVADETFEKEQLDALIHKL